jgi:hypothetical protein
VLVVVLSILNKCVPDFCVVLWSEQYQLMALFMVFNLCFGPGFILSLVVNFDIQ